MAADSVKAETVNILLEFFEVAINTILYTRKIYPKEIFVLRKKYNIPVRISSHPRVNEYITESLKGLKSLLEVDNASPISMLVVITRDGRTLEQHVFEIGAGQGADDKYLVESEETFRQYLLKLSVLPWELDDCSFSIGLLTSNESFVRLNESVALSHFPWIEAEDESRINNINFTIIPLKSLQTSAVTLQMFIECG